MLMLLMNWIDDAQLDDGRRVDGASVGYTAQCDIRFIVRSVQSEQ